MQLPGGIAVTLDCSGEMLTNLWRGNTIRLVFRLKHGEGIGLLINAGERDTHRKFLEYLAMHNSTYRYLRHDARPGRFRTTPQFLIAFLGARLAQPSGVRGLLPLG